MEDKLKQLHTFKTVSLSDEERGSLRANLSYTVSANVCVPAATLSTYFSRGIQHGLRISLSVLFFVVFVGGSVSAIADSALPGDPLYTFKINVNEEVKGAFLSSPEEKVAWQKNRVETRVAEIRTLADSKTLTKAKQEKAHQALTTQVDKLSKELTVLSDETPAAALTVTASLEESLKDTKAKLQENNPTIALSAMAMTTEMSDEQPITTAATGKRKSEEDSVKAALETVEAALAKVSKEEVKILTKEITNIAKEVETANKERRDTESILSPTKPASEKTTPSEQ